MNVCWKGLRKLRSVKKIKEHVMVQVSGEVKSLPE